MGKEEQLYDEFLNKGDNFLSVLLSAQELRIELKWNVEEQPRKESLNENAHFFQRLPDLPSPTYPGKSGMQKPQCSEVA